MVYGSDISEGGDYSEIAFTLSNPQTSASLYQLADYNYDVAINGLPFFLGNGDQYPYRRVTAQYRKEQYDQTREAGEQSLTGWWFRSQSSFHLGAGIKYFEPAQDESLRFQFTESKGLDIWTKGQATLLNNTASFYSGAAPAQLIGVNDGTNDCIFFTDGTALKKSTTAGGSPTTITQAGTASTIYSLTTDGSNYYFINGTKVHRGSVGATPADSEIYNTPSTTRATIRYVKQRLLLAKENVLYELNANASASAALPTALYTMPNSTWVWSSIAEGPAAIYVSGYDPNGTSSSIFKITLDTATANSLGFPELNVPTVTIDLPAGERINGFDVYLGTYAVIATSKGVRGGIVSTTGDITYGPLLYDGAACYDVTFTDRFAYVTTTVDGEAGLVKIDLSTTIGNTLVFPYAWDLIATGTSATASQVSFFGNSDRLAFSTGNNIWAESTGEKVDSGYLQTGYIRFNTLEDKIFKFISPRVTTTDGAVQIYSIGEYGTEYDIGGYAQGAATSELGIAYPLGNHQYLGFKFILNRSSTDNTKGPLLTGYQLKALPAVLRQRLIQFPLMCYDHESDNLNNEVGYDGRAFDRLSSLETIENYGDTVRVQDFRTGESFIGLIEEMNFVNLTPSDKRFSGFGGTLTVTIRTV